MFDLKLFRKANKMNQTDAAKYFGCGQSFISQIESNLSPIPDSFITKILSDTNIILVEGIERENTGCKLCAEKDKVIKALEKYNSLLEETVEEQKRKIASLESGSTGEINGKRQTA